jgi:hypothetical protein
LDFIGLPFAVDFFRNERDDAVGQVDILQNLTPRIAYALSY